MQVHSTGSNTVVGMPFDRLRAQSPGREPEFDDIPVGHDVVLAFQPDFASGAGILHRPSCDKIIERDDFGSDETFLKVAMDDTSSLGCGGTLANRPGTRLLGTCRQKGLQAQRVEANASQDVQTWFSNAHLGKKLPRLPRLHLDQLGLDLGIEKDRLGRCNQGAEALLERFVAKLIGIAVENIEEWLCSKQEKIT